MSLLFFADVHGDWNALKKLERVIEERRPDKLVLLGDIFYKYPATSDLTELQKIADLLASYGERLTVVAGNCDMWLPPGVKINFPIIENYIVLEEAGYKVFCTHGHRFGLENPPPAQVADIMLFGHIHIPFLRYITADLLAVCPGSIALPKQSTRTAYGWFENRHIEVVSLSENKVLLQTELTFLK